MPDAVPIGDTVRFAMLCAVVIVAAIIDWRTELTPNWLTLPAILLGLIWGAVGGALEAGGSGAMAGLAASAIGLAAALIPFGMIYAAGGLGGGDVKLMAAVGAIAASWQVVLATTFYAFVAGALMAVFIMVHRGLVKRTFYRIFGAAMMKAAKVEAELPTDSPRIPFAVAIAIGATLAGAEILLNVHTPWRGL